MTPEAAGKPLSADATAWPATTIAARVRAREVTAEDIVRAHLARIAARDGELGAFQVVREQAALKEAHEQSRRSDLATLPLAGVPVAIKDCVDVAGEPTRSGSGATSAQPAARDDELVARLRRAGAIVVGKTQLPELAIWPFTEPAAFRPTHNPWNLERTPGGSSGGSAAAVAARMVPIALGSDGGGSIRIPSACCGIAGLKPGPGLVPVPGPTGEHWLGMSAYGPLARSIGDLALMFDVLRGAAPGPAPTAPGSLTIAVSTVGVGPGIPVAADVSRAIEQLARQLAAAGHRIVRADPPYGLDFAWRYLKRYFAGIALDAAGLDLSAVEPKTRKMVEVGRWIQRRGWAQPAAADEFGARMKNWFGTYDVLVTPTLTRPAIRIGRYRDSSWMPALIGVARWLCTAPWNLARWPAASVPAGLSLDGLPIGAQLVAPPGGESKLLALMAQIEQLQPWPDAPG